MEKSQEATPVASGSYIDVRLANDEMEATCVVAVGHMAIFFWITVAKAICTMSWMPLVGIANGLPVAAVIIGSLILLMRFTATEQNLRLEADEFQSYTIGAAGKFVFSGPISHAQIESIQWPLNSSDKKLMVEVQLKDAEPKEDANHVASDQAEKHGASNLTQTGTFNLRHLSSPDRRLLVRYLSNIEVPQDNWNEFCYKFAQKWTGNPKRYLGNGWLANQFKSAPIRTAALLSPLLMLRAALTASCYLYWLMGVTILISTLVNVRLFHSTWVPPIGTWLLAGGFGLVLVGCVAYLFQARIESPESSGQTVDADEQPMSWWSGGLLVASLILVPLLIQLAFIWELPPLIGVHLILLILLSPLLPYFWRSKAHAAKYRTDPDACHKEANQIWEASWES